MLAAVHCLQRGYTFDIFERNSHLNGRIHSNSEYECGAFRLKDSHTKTIALAKHLGLHVKPWPLEKHTTRKLFNTPRSRHAIPTHDIGLSMWDTVAITNNRGVGDPLSGVKVADGAEEWTGYRGSFIDSADPKAGSYVRNSHGKNYFVEEGLQAIPDRLVKMYGLAKHARIQTRVTNVKKKGSRYQVDWVNRNESGNKIYDQVVLAISPLHATDFDIVKEHGKPLVSLLAFEPRHRIYAKVDVEDTTKKVKWYDRIISNTLLQQTIGCPPLSGKKSEWVQVSYSGGDVAKMWNRLKLNKPKLFKQLLRRELEQVLGTRVRLYDIQSHYWEDAVHATLPSFRYPQRELFHTLHKTKCPDVFWVGESVSSERGWIEGAVRSVLSLRRSFPTPESRIPVFSSLRDIFKSGFKEWIVYDGRVLDVTQWKKVHPGSAKAIENHLYEDVTQLWNIYHAQSSFAWKTILGLQVGYVSSFGNN